MKKTILSKVNFIAALFLISSTLIQCGGGSSSTNNSQEPNSSENPSSSSEIIEILAEVLGLKGAGLQISINGVETVSILENGSTTLVEQVNLTDSFSFTVVQQPNDPNQKCEITPASGVVSDYVNASNQAQIKIECVDTFGLSISANALADDVVVRNSDGEEITISSNSNNSFNRQFLTGESFSLSLTSVPSAQSCILSEQTGIFASDNISLTLNCTNKLSVPSNLSDFISFAGSAVDCFSSDGNNNGQAIVAWKQTVYSDAAEASVQPVALIPGPGPSNESSFIVFAEFDGQNWSLPQSFDDAINVNSLNRAFCPSVQISDNGDAIITWDESDGSDDRLMVSEKRNNTWTHPSSYNEAFSFSSSDIFDDTIAMDSLGNTIIAWTQNDGAQIELYVATYRNGSWNKPANLSDTFGPAGYGKRYPSASISDADTAIIAWVQDTNSSEFAALNQIFVSELRSGSWTHPAADEFISHDTYSATLVETAMNSKGEAVVAWLQKKAVVPLLYVSTYHNGTWTHSSSIDDHLSLANWSTRTGQIFPVIDDTTGQIDIVFGGLEQTGTSVAAYFHAQYIPGGSWTSPSGDDDVIRGSADYSFNDTDASSFDRNADGSNLFVYSERNNSNTDRKYIAQQSLSGLDWTHDFDESNPRWVHLGNSVQQLKALSFMNSDNMILWTESSDDLNCGETGNESCLHLYFSQYKN